MSTSSTTLPTLEGPGSVSGAPNLLAGFTDTFTSRVPVLAIGGVESAGEGVGTTMKLVRDDVQTVVLPETGHWVAEPAPDELLAALTAFLAPYRDGPAAVPEPGQAAATTSETVRS